MNNMLCKFDIGSISLRGRYLTWVISKFHSLPLRVGVEIRSPEFVYRDIRYTLVIWPRGQKFTGSEEWFGICLYKGNGARSTEPAQFSIVNNQGTIKKCTAVCSENNIFKQARFMQWSDFSTLIHKIAPSGCLTIVCRLPVESDLEDPIESDNDMEMFTSSMKDPPVKFQPGDYRTLDSMPMMTSLGFADRNIQSSLDLMSPDFGHSSPSTVNSFFSTSSCENSYEIVPESAETENQDLKMPCNVPNAVNSENTFWSFFKHSLSQSNETNQPDITLDSVESIPENAEPKNAHDCTLVPEDTNSSQFSNISRSNSSVASKETSQVPIPGTVCKNYSPLKKILSASVGETYSQNNNSLQDLVDSSISKSSQRTQLVAEPSSSADHCPKGLEILSQYLKNVYLQGKVFDLTIIIEGRKFKVLKVILSRSPVFKELLAKDNGNIISVNPFDSCDSSNFHDFLLYMYSGQVDLSHRNVFGLYSAACKFEMPDLKEECIRFLRQSLSIGTITDILRLINGESELLEEAILFLAKNLDLILDTDEWSQFMRDDPKRVAKYQHKALEVGFQKVI